MRSLKQHSKILFATFIFIALFLSKAQADSQPANPSALMPEPWEKFSVSLGVFFSESNSQVRVGSGLGLDVDVEDALGLESQTNVLRAEAFWRFTPNRRHRLDASWFSLRRSANRTLGEDFDFKDDDGNTMTILAGSEIATHFDLDIIEAAYSYSFLQDDRIDLAVIGGVYIMPLDFGFDASGAADGAGNINFTAPLPVVGARMDVLITPKWYLRTGSQFFYLKYQNFTGQLTQLRAAVEFVPVKRLAIGVGVDSMHFGLEGTDEDYPGIDLKGNVDFQYTGLQLYGKLRF